MHKLLARTVSFLTAFAIGLTALVFDGRVIRCEPDSTKEPHPEIVEYERRTNQPIEVSFNGFVTEDGNEFAEFRITNFSDETFYYSTYTKTKNQRDKEIWREVEIDGKLSITRWCGTGVVRGEIGSGETVYSRVYLTSISYDYKKGKTVRIGYSLYRDLPSVDEISWSDPLPVSTELEKWLLEEKRRIS